MSTGERERIGPLLAGMEGRRVVVVGDVMLDRYVIGRVRRISPEAPVPVVEYGEEILFPGGAANVAANVAGLGGVPRLVGVVGGDGVGAELAAVLEGRGIAVDGLVAIPERPTTEKVRIVANRQQLLRIDRERMDPLDPGAVERVLDAVERSIEKAEAVVVEDYGKGLITPDLLHAIVRRAEGRGVPVVFDPKENHPVPLDGVTVATPNRREAFGLAGLPEAAPVDPPDRDEALKRVGRVLLERWGCANVLITLGERGMYLFSSGGPSRHIPTMAREVFDVSGAGDTVAAAVALALAAGAAVEEACALANHAAGVVVGKAGTAAATPDEILESLKA